MKASHVISACYFPKMGEADLSWENIETGEVVEITVPVSEKDGNQIAKVIWPCVYHNAVVKGGK